MKSITACIKTFTVFGTGGGGVVIDNEATDAEKDTKS